MVQLSFIKKNIMSYSLKITTTVLLLLFLTSCGTIIHGTTEQVGVTSSPSGATVEIDKIKIGETPLVQELSRKDTHSLKISMNGYESYEMIINRTVSGWVWGNIVFGGLIGLVVDAATGGMYKLSPNEINAQLSESGRIALQDGNSDINLFVELVEKADDNWEKIGQLEISK